MYVQYVLCQQEHSCMHDSRLGNTKSLKDSKGYHDGWQLQMVEHTKENIQRT